MIVVTVTYPASEGSKFDLDYYLKTHIPLVHARWDPLGLQDLQILRGTGAPGGGAATFLLVALLTFESEAAFGQAAKQHGKEVLGDIKNFTDITPAVQFNERLS